MDKQQLGQKKVMGMEAFVFLALFIGFFALFGVQMGVSNMLSTMMQTAYQLLMHTALYIMAVAVIAGAISSLLSEFGVVALADRALSPVIVRLFGLPGAASIGAITTYLSDNPAILTLAQDKRYARYFKRYQLPALTNLGTGFGMGAIITTFVLGLQGITGESYALPALVGNIGAMLGALVSTRLMLWHTARHYGKEEWCEGETGTPLTRDVRVVRTGNVGSRFLSAMLDGGQTGVQMGLAIIPGVLVVCTFVLMLTNPAPAAGYSGGANEGIALLPRVGQALQFILKPLFGFSSPEGISVPITALGSSGASLSIIQDLLRNGLANGRDVAVFTAICMCFSGYLSTHVAMMEQLHATELTGKAILSHTVGGLCAGIAANWLYQLITWIF